jgi:hypothetical protein
MNAIFRELARRTLSPATYYYLRFCRWNCSYYLPRLAASVCVRRTPTVEGFPSGQAPSPLVDELRDINLFAPTRMCHVMTRYGSDKGSGAHNYTAVYSALFGRLRDRPLRIFELGLGTNNPNLPSTMGATGHPGASLRGWRELFPHASIYGADIDRDILFEEDRIKTFYCDQLDGAAIRELWEQPELRDGVDIIVEDGLHTFEANVSFLDGSLEHLRPGGVYVVEDIKETTFEKWRNRLESVYTKRFPDYEFALAILPGSFSPYGNNLLIVRRRN